LISLKHLIDCRISIMNEYGLLDVPSSPRKMASTKSTADKLELTKKVSENLSQ
jgi:hypothetical protein